MMEKTITIKKPDCPICGIWDDVEHENNSFWWCSRCSHNFEFDAVGEAMLL